jgi:hypothetical protein
MNKNLASQLVNSRLGNPILNPNNNGNVHWSNINISKEVWWFDIPVTKFKNDLHLILNDERSKQFYWILIKGEEISNPYSCFRKLRKNYVSIEISSEKTNMFVDVKNGGTEINFSKFKIKNFHYSDSITKEDFSLDESKTSTSSSNYSQLPVHELENQMLHMFKELATIQDKIKKILEKQSDNKILKGNELVGWLGEIYGKLLFQGTLVDDSFEHDIETKDGKRISVKTRKGWRSGWKQSSAIPKITGSECPTHLLFVHLNDNYSIDGIWLFDWGELNDGGRFRKHMVRGNLRSFIFHLNEKKDKINKIYP